MVFSDDFLHFLKIKTIFFLIHQNYLVALKYYNFKILIFPVSYSTCSWRRKNILENKYYIFARFMQMINHNKYQ